jgi:glycosyltransferase involved in cell wall biosynthesis
MKGVIMLVNYFPPLPTGGAQRQAERLATYLAARGVRVGVITRRVGPLLRHERRDGFDVNRLMQIGPGKMKTLTFTLAAIIALLRLRDSYDILHAHLASSPAIAGAIAGKLLRKRVIVKFGNSDSFGDVQSAQKSWRGRLRLFILRRWADLCIALDPEMEKEILGAGFTRDRVILMDNGIEAGDFLPCSDKAGAKKVLGLIGLENKTVILYTGRLVAQKALHLLLEAMQHALNNYQDLHLLIIGHGEEKDALIALTKKLRIQDNVSFVEQVDDVKPFLNAADIFALPSLAEGISNSLLEAMSCGLACIVTRVGGSPEVLGNGEYGLLINPNNSEELSDAIMRLRKDDEERHRLGIKARDRILERYDFRVVGRQYHDLYNRLLEKQ